MSQTERKDDSTPFRAYLSKVEELLERQVVLAAEGSSMSTSPNSVTLARAWYQVLDELYTVPKVQKAMSDRFQESQQRSGYSDITGIVDLDVRLSQLRNRKAQLKEFIEKVEAEDSSKIESSEEVTSLKKDILAQL